jgi:hypothetical protein
MQFIHFTGLGGDLGVGCNFCHVEVNGSTDGQFEKDEQGNEKSARKMRAMVMDINKTSCGGEQAVTCYACHRGSPQAATIPALL